MRSISTRDALIFYIAKSASPDVSRGAIEYIFNNIENPDLLKLAVDEYLSELKKETKSVSKLKILKDRYAKLLALKRKQFKRLGIEAREKNKTYDRQVKIYNLVFRCIQFVNDHPRSKILDEYTNPFNQRLRMFFADKIFSVEFRYKKSPYSHGRQWVKVKIRQRTVFEVEGQVFDINGQKVKTYIPGTWENKLFNISTN